MEIFFESGNVLSSRFTEASNMEKIGTSGWGGFWIILPGRDLVKKQFFSFSSPLAERFEASVKTSYRCPESLGSIPLSDNESFRIGDSCDHARHLLGSDTVTATMANEQLDYWSLTTSTEMTVHRISCFCSSKRCHQIEITWWFDEIYTHEILHWNISSNQSPPNTNE